MSEVIQHVSDTSFWVAYYRSLETERQDALFKDPYARILVGPKAAQFEKMKSPTMKWTQWTVVMRTYIIDRMILDLIDQGVTTFVNLGAGLDTRPYRMGLEKNIKWIEVDFQHVIEHKAKHLISALPTCDLERISLDLSDRKQRQNLFLDLANRNVKIAVLTEGVLPYLTVEQVSELSEDLMKHKNFKYWICEYISPKAYPHLRSPQRMKALKNAPFQFFPEDWFGFFTQRGWKLVQDRYYHEISEKFKRSTPLPKIFKFIGLFMGQKRMLPFKRMSGYLMWEQKN
jgi:methyltransferase (TIGR00027 family)